MERTYAEGQNEDKVTQPYQAAPRSKQPNFHGDERPPGKVENYLIARRHRSRPGRFRRLRAADEWGFR